MNITENRPIVFILFGITGDLAKKKIIPAIFSLHRDGKLPKDFSVVGFGRRDFTKKEFESYIKSVLNQDNIDDFLSIMDYIKGDFFDVSSYKNLLEYLSNLDKNKDKCFSKIFYLAVLPQLYEQIFENINKSGLFIVCRDSLGDSFSRLLVEKPFGFDLNSFEKLNTLSKNIFSEKDIFRIDHYNSKSFMKDIKDFDFKQRDVSKIEIKLFEKNTLEDRIEFYDSLGAIYDVFQNHLLQIFAFLLSKDISEKSVVLNKLTLDRDSIYIGQYLGYRDYNKLNPLSKTETFLKVKFLYEDIPVYFITGKGLNEDVLEVSIFMKNGEIKEIKSDQSKNDAYEKIISASISGDKDFFVSEDELLYSWKISDVLKKEAGSKELQFYKIGTKTENIAKISD